jgi:hypothetical protein
MSLDVTLISPEKEEKYCHCCGFENLVAEEVYTANITHNLGSMAIKAGIYEALWRPEEINATKAKDISEILEEGLFLLKEKPDYFKQFDSENGWGIYEHFVPFVEEYLNACKTHPEAIIEISR